MEATAERDVFVGKLVDRHKPKIRREDVRGHLPVCWGILTAALNVSLGKYLVFAAQSTHIFMTRCVQIDRFTSTTPEAFSPQP